MTPNRIAVSLSGVLIFFSLASAQTTEVVHFTIDATRDVKAISRYIYGVNQFHGVVDGLSGPWSNAAFTRLGGNRLTAYNWVNNASNSGSDRDFRNDDYLVSGPMYTGIEDSPGAANIPILDITSTRKIGLLLTIPINGFVAADKRGEGDVKKSGEDFLLTRFKPELPRKGSAFILTPDPTSGIVYEDEFVNWVTKKYPNGFTDPSRPIWFSLDNEPDWWKHTHAEIHSEPTGYAELILKSIAYANAAKDVAPNALLFGPVNYGWAGYIQLQNAPNELGDFQSIYLKEMSMAEKVYGRRLLDVFDVHWYPEARGGGERITETRNPTTAPFIIQARLQAPRSLWDPTYTETSWIAKDSTHGPIKLLLRLKDKIQENYPGTKLAITEYNYGGGTDISGGIAEADVLGIFGRESVFAAAIWPGRNIPYIGGGFEMFRNYDGKNGSFGDTSVRAESDNIVDSSIYASIDSNDPSRMVIVAINKTDHPIQADIEISHGAGYKQVNIFQLTGHSSSPEPEGEFPGTDGGHFQRSLPPFSVTTLSLR
jgi:hypothetical protein